MNLPTLHNMMLFVAEKMVESEPTLTALDQVIGDGDHGIGMKRGFAAVMVQINDPNFNPKDVGDFFTQIGTKLMTSMSGASGAIFGTFFRAGGKSLSGVTDFTTQALADLLNHGWQAVYARGNAKPGDKTMVDALAAAAEKAATLTTCDLKTALPQIADAAMAGAEKTKQMVAVFGRAKNLGERAVGHVDPGSISMAYIIKYMNEFIQK
ncbi:dihydroxyacetone kinase subunit DhaL [Orbaceae bacterium ESL0727]|nr:dihydroxyacetone kinase subunit DhaL [Orbaceae bacterium ESL0727]